MVLAYVKFSAKQHRMPAPMSIKLTIKQLNKVRLLMPWWSPLWLWVLALDHLHFLVLQPAIKAQCLAQGLQQEYQLSAPECHQAHRHSVPLLRPLLLLGSQRLRSLPLVNQLPVNHQRNPPLPNPLLVSRRSQALVAVPLDSLARIQVQVFPLLQDRLQLSDRLCLSQAVRLSDRLRLRQVVQLSDRLCLSQAVQLSDRLHLKQAVQLLDRLCLSQAAQLSDRLRLRQVVQLSDRLRLRQVVQLSDRLRLSQAVQLSDCLHLRQVVQLSDRLRHQLALRPLDPLTLRLLEVPSHSQDLVGLPFLNRRHHSNRCLERRLQTLDPHLAACSLPALRATLLPRHRQVGRLLVPPAL